MKKIEVDRGISRTNQIIRIGDKFAREFMELHLEDGKAVSIIAIIRRGEMRPTVLDFRNKQALEEFIELLLTAAEIIEE